MSHRPSRRVRWPYTRRRDHKIAVTLDSNAWNILFDNAVDLVAEFPADQFALFVPREVEIEAEAIRKPELMAFIRESINRANVVTTATLGFDTGERPQRVAPMGFGTFQSATEAEIYRELRFYLRVKHMGSGLHKNEGDAAVAVASFFSVVLTAERRNKKGPLNFAFQNGGKILYLEQPTYAVGSLREKVLACYRAND